MDLDVDSLSFMRCRGKEPQERCRGPRGSRRSFEVMPWRKAKLHERNAQGVASLGMDEGRNTGWVGHKASAKAVPGAENPIRLLLHRLVRL